MSKLFRHALLLLLFCSLAQLGRPLFAQTSFGQISGTVLDPSGAAIPEVQVTLTEQSTGITRTFQGDGNGFFNATNLPIGTYTLSATHAGFGTAQQKDIVVAADAKITANLNLNVGSSTEVVQVQAGSSETVNATSGEVSRVIDTKQVENLALNGRNYTQLMTLIPGAVVTNPDIFSVTTSLASNNQTINGNRADSGNLTVDGAYNQVAGSNSSLMNIVGPDFIQEVKIDTSNASAEFGRTSGPSFNIVTKSGSNAFHGGAFEVLRNNYLDAHNYFTTKTTQLVFNDFGGFVGGPIIKDKLFFFVGEEWKRLRQQATASRFTVPATALLNGDFSSQPQLYFPGTSNPIPGNNIASLITPDGKAIGNVYRLMSSRGVAFNDTPTGNNLTLAPSNPLNFHQDLVRLDYQINQKNSIYGRWIHDQNVLTDPYGTFSNSGVLPTTPTLRMRPGQSYLVSETWTIRQNLINQVTANTSWAAQRIPPAGDTWQRSKYGFGYAKLYPNAGRYPTGIPIVNITGYAPFQGPNFALLAPSTDIEASDTLTWVKGNHLVKAGGVFIRDRVDQNGRSNYTGTANFNAATGCKTAGFNTTCNALADALLGNFNSYQEASADPIGHFRFTQPEAFVQDTWKAARKLSLEYGVRWQLILPFYTQGNNISNFDPQAYNPGNAVTVTPGATVVPGSGNSYNGLVRAGDIPSNQTVRVPNVNTSLYSQIPIGSARGLYKMHGNFGPRLGFAYNPEPNTVIRGGFGAFYFRPEGNLIFSQLNLPPFLSNTEYDFGNLSTVSAGSTNNTGLQGTISGINPLLKNPYTYQYSLGVQHQLPRGVFFETNYVGNVAHHLVRQPNINFPNLAQVAAAPSGYRPNFYNPYKGYTTINEWLSDSNTNYNSLQVYVAKRTGFLTFTTSYTYSKNLGDSSSNNGTLENWQNLAYNYGPTSNDRRHALVATWILQAPDFRGHNVLVREAIGGWQLAGVLRLQSGAYYNVTSSTAVTTRRSDQLPGAAVYASHRTANCYVNNGSAACGSKPSAFVAAPASRFGNSGSGVIVGPGLAQADMSLAKYFALHGENLRLKFQGDVFNALNRTNYNGVNLTTTSSNFGTISSAYPPRQMQLTLKLLF